MNMIPINMIFFVSSFFAQVVNAAPAGLTLQGRLVKDDVAITGPVTLTVSVRSPNSDLCLLFEETHSLTLHPTDGGIFSVQIGGGTRSVNDKGFSILNTFSNTGVAINSLSCPGTGATSYTPLASHSRYVYLSFSTDVGTVAFNDPYVVQSVPYALEAEKLAGKSSSDFLQTVTTLEITPGTTQSRMARILDTDYSVIDALLNGTSTQYMTSSSTTGTNIPVLSSQPGSLTAGKMWYEGGALKYYDGASSTVKTLGTTSGSVSSVATGTGLTGGPITSTGTISLASGVIASPGTYSSVTVDTYGRVTAGTNPTTASEYGITDAVIKGGQLGAVTLGTSDANSLTLNTNNTAKMTILSSGNVGIGTTVPAVPLHVFGTLTQQNRSGQDGNDSFRTVSSDGIIRGNIYASSTYYATQASNGARLDFIQTDPTKTISFWGGAGGNTRQVTIDSSNGNFGIGTASPGAMLDVEGTAFFNSNASISGNAFRNQITLGNTTAHKVQTGQGAPVTLEYNMWNNASNTTALAINGHNATIGGGIPLLELNRSNASNGIGLTAVSTGSYLGRISFGGADGTDFKAGAQISAIVNGAVSAGVVPTDLLFSTTSNGIQAEAMRISNTGNVGIGTTAPGSALHVGAGSVSSIPNGAGTSFTPQLQNSQTSGVAGIAVSVADGVNNRRAGLFVDQTNAVWGLSTSYSSGSIPFVINNAGTELIRLTAAGRFGVGTNAPTSYLHLKAGAAAAQSAPLKFTAGTNLTTPENGAVEFDGTNLFFTSGGTRRSLASTTGTGTLSGIDTISNTGGSITVTPSAGNSLIVNQTTTSTNSSSGALIVNGGAGIAGALNVAGNIVGSANMTATTALYTPLIYGGTTASQNLTLDSTSNATKGNILLAPAGGNIAIGAVGTPTSKVLVGATQSATLNSSAGIVIDQSGTSNNNYTTLGFSWAQSTGNYTPLAGMSFRGTSYASATGDLAFFTGGSNERMTIMNTGNVGIGTTVPGEKLSVGYGANTDFAVGTATNNKLYLGTYNNNAGIGINRRINDGAFANASLPHAEIGFYTSSADSAITLSTANTNNTMATERMRVDKNGNVGIGTTSPSEKLHVSGGNLRLDTSKVINWNTGNSYIGDTVGADQIRVAGYNGVDIFTAVNTKDITFTNNQTGQLMVIKGTGNVGIGTVSPGYKLDVQGGDINASGSVRAAGVALTSDIRYKRDIEPLDNALEKILNIRGVSYNWRTEEFPQKHFNDRHQVGVIAQEVEQQFPEVVDTNKDGYKSVNYPALVAPLIEAVKTLYNRLTGVEATQGNQAREIASKADKAETEALRADNKAKDQEIQKLKQENAAVKSWICAKDPKAAICK